MMDWALQCIRQRLPDMLSLCGATELAAHVDQEQIDAALTYVVELVDRAAAA